ncbi:GNAT superfamily N-acetyltransferase [Mycetocola sp. CAN_C7]|uniref:GNAT family N-acetyltransferase n=1 Tax=Mycetocola sp. CAN_C7 TaxID=2787724 RepID=UPI001A1EE945
MPLTTIGPDGEAITLRRAVAADVHGIVALLAADRLRAAVESTAEIDRAGYERAFHAIDNDPAHLLVVGTDAGGAVVATMQLTFLPGLARAGATRLQIEAVRVHSDLRGRGIGGAMIEWAVDEGRRRGVTLVQLTSDRSRTEAHRFYERLGFEQSHTGFKLAL